MRSIVAAGLAATLLALAAPTVPAAAIADGQITPSVECGTCHRDIYETWRSSAHARAMESVVFLKAYRETEARDAATARLCLECHAPLTRVSPDPDLTRQATWDGVSCDSCHSLVSVELAAGGAKQTFDPGPVKRGPIRDAASAAHETEYSPLHATALVCAGCHEFHNAEGTPIITTYSEWLESAASRKGQPCQACHMALVRANVVDPKLKRATTDRVNVHDMPGGHSFTQLSKALGVSMSAVRPGDGLALTVRVRNKGGGHAVPTGMPGRRVILAVTVRTSDDKSFSAERVYTKAFHDAQGRPITHDGPVFAPGVRLESDSRLRPDEERMETFFFPVAAGASALVTAKLHYEHAPTGNGESRTWLTFYSAQRRFGADGE